MKPKHPPTISQLKRRIKRACDHLCAAAADESGTRYLHSLIDNAVRELQGDNYDRYVKAAKRGANGPDTYTWFTGE